MARLDVTETFHSITFPGHLHTQDSLNYATNFKFRDTDTVIVTYPKSGTTWMQEIITLVLSKGDPTIAQTQPNWARAPWLEQYYCRDVLEVSAGPRIITTHLPYHLLAPALQDSKAKVIYVARNLKDVSVSYYHFHKVANFLPDPGTFSEFLSAFLEGKVHYGSWFDHVKGWTIHSKNIQNFLYITYEEMMQDLHGALEKVSRFLQCPLAEDELVLAQKHCTFNSMKENAMVNYTLIPQEIMDHSKGKFMRKGKHIMAKFLDDKVKVFGMCWKRLYRALDSCVVNIRSRPTNDAPLDGSNITTFVFIKRSISSRSCIVSARVQRSVSLFQHIPNTSSKVGDWKNIFTEEQSCLVDDVYSFQMADSSLLFKWECPRETKTSDNIYIPPSPREIDLLT